MAKKKATEAAPLEETTEVRAAHTEIKADAERPSVMDVNPVVRTPSVEEEAKRAQEVSEAEDALLAKLDSDHGFEADEADETVAVKPKAKAEEADAGETTEQPESSDRLEKAVQALRLDGATTEDLAKLDEDAILAWGERASERQSKTDESFRALKEKSETASDEEQEDQEEPASAEPAGKPALASLDDSMRELEDLFGEDAAALKKPLEAIVERFESQTQALQNALLEIQLAGVRDQLAGENPALNGEEAWTAVISKANDLVTNGSYDSATDAVRDAELLLYGKGDRQVLRQDAEEAMLARANGSVTLGSARAQERGLKTTDDFEDAILAALEDGDSGRAKELGRAMNNGFGL